VREIAGEDDEIRLLRQAVHRGDRLLERVGGIGVGRAAEAPMRVAELEEEKILRRRLGVREAVRPREAGGEGHPAQPGQPGEVAAIDLEGHRDLPWCA
jgi:hypothetical protein